MDISRLAHGRETDSPMQSACSMAKATWGWGQGLKPPWRAGVAQLRHDLSWWFPDPPTRGSWEGGSSRRKALECKECAGPPGRECLGNRVVGTFSQRAQGPRGRRGTPTRHHLLAPGSGLSSLEAFPGSEAGSPGAPAGPGRSGLWCQPLAQHQQRACGPWGSEVWRAELCGEPPGHGEDPLQTLTQVLKSRYCVLV